MRLFTVAQIRTSNCFAALRKMVTPETNQESSALYLPSRLKKCVTLFLLILSLKFVVDHAAKPEIKKGIVDDWRSGMELLAQNQNVSCKM